jgi:hypothetical protein
LFEIVGGETQDGESFIFMSLVKLLKTSVCKIKFTVLSLVMQTSGVAITVVALRLSWFRRSLAYR